MMVKMLYMLLLQRSEAKRTESYSHCQAVNSLPEAAGAAQQRAAYSQLPLRRLANEVNNRGA
jgi:hypothetical protein